MNSNRVSFMKLYVLLILLLPLLACNFPLSGSPPAPARPSTPPTRLAPTFTSPPPTVAPLITPDSSAYMHTDPGNFTYDLAEFGSVTLTDGTYHDSDSSAHADLGSTHTSGDLNGDSQRDALVVIGYNAGGSGIFVHIVALVAEGETLVQAGTLYVGDRSPVLALDITEDGTIIADVIVSGPNDPSCCPTQEETWTLRLEGGELVRVP